MKMKIHKKAKASLLTIMGSLLVVSSVHASIAVNYQFKKDTGPTYAGTGAYTGSAGTYWNTLDFVTTTTNYTAPATVYESDGTTASSISLDLSFNDGTIGSFNTTGGTGSYNELTQAYLFTKDTGMVTFTLSGLAASADYRIYLYGSNSGYQSDSAKFTINGTTATLKNSGQTTFSWEADNNYTTIDATSDASGILTGTMTRDTTVEGAFNGLQVVAIPEPAALSMVVLCGGGIWMLRRYFAM